MSRIDRISSMVTARRTSRTQADGAGSSGTVNLPVPVGQVERVAPAMGAELQTGDSEFATQLMGQEGQRRGLRAGPGFIDAARHAYNRVEYSGSWDRRARTGGRTRTDI